MLTPCRLTTQARKSLQQIFGVEALSAEAEFKELPYFLVARSRASWDVETRGDINAISLVEVTERGLIVDPERPGEDEPERLTLIPWQNVISLSAVRPAANASG